MLNVFVFIISFLLLSLRINSFPLKNWDEAWYAEIIKNMTHGSGLMVPFWNGQYYFDKPPLYFILSLPITKIFGVGEWQVRLVSILAGAVVSVLILSLVHHLFSRRIGLLSVCFFLSSIMVYRRFSEGNLDSLLLLFILLPQYLVVVYHGRHQVPLLAVSFFLGTLVKSWFFMGIPFLICLLWLIVSKQEKILKNLLVAGIYAALLYLLWIFIGSFNYGHIFYRWYLLKPAGYNYEKVGLSLNLNLIISLFVSFGLWLFVWISVRHFPKLAKSTKMYLLTNAVVSLIYFVSLLFAADQFDWYLLPIYPLIAVVLAAGLEKITPKLLICLLALQVSVVIYLLKTDPDQSSTSALLAKDSKAYIQKGDQVFLNSPDFSTFLYYSDFGQIYSLKNGGGKPWEWWIISPDRAKQLAEQSSRTSWFIPLDLNLKKPYH